MPKKIKKCTKSPETCDYLMEYELFIVKITEWLIENNVINKPTIQDNSVIISLTDYGKTLINKEGVK